VAIAHRVETAFVFDFDGALIGSVYQHVLAWQDEYRRWITGS
jgi:beta-phosphoglucomutase-like phosphatase (HAD superfamily)